MSVALQFMWKRSYGYTELVVSAHTNFFNFKLPSITDIQTLYDESFNSFMHLFNRMNIHPVLSNDTIALQLHACMVYPASHFNHNKFLMNLLLHLLERIYNKLSRKDSPSAVSPSPRKDPRSTVSPRRKVSPAAASPSPRKDPSSAVSSERIHHQLLLHLLERVNQQLLLIHHAYRASPSPRKEPPAAVSYASLLERIHHQLLLHLDLIQRSYRISCMQLHCYTFS